MTFNAPRTVLMIASRSQLAPDGRTMLRRGFDFFASEREAQGLERCGLAVRAPAAEADAATSAPAEAPVAGPGENKEDPAPRRKPGPKPKVKA